MALAITDQDHLEHLLIHRANTWWEEVFLLYAGSVPDVSMLLRRLLGQDQDHPLGEDIFSTNLLLAGRCLSSRPTIRDTSLRELVTSHLFATLQSTPYPLLQRQVAEVLAATSDPQSSKNLVRLLSDASLDKYLRGRIAEALGNLGERTVAGELVRLLSDASLDEYLRERIALALGNLGERTVAGELVRLLSDASLDEYLQGSIAEALGNLGERTVASELVRLLSDASLDEYLRGSIALALGNLGERTVASELVRLLSDASLDEYLQGSIAEALKMLATDPISIHQLARLLAYRTLVDIAYDILWTVSRQAGVSIFPLHEPSDEVVEIVSWDDTAQWR